jgi:hypothetical protein
MHNMHTMNTKKFKTVRMSSRWQIIAYMIHMPHVLLVSYQYQIQVSNNARKTVSVSLGTTCLLSFCVMIMNVLFAIYGVSSLVIHVK